MAERFDRQRLTAALHATLQPLERARTLPAACYDAEPIHALEQEMLFASHWLAVARDEDLPHAGSFVTRDIGRERVLVVRGRDARLRAFFNVCRHRGSRLVEQASGRLQQAIVCPYHAWSYELDGRLQQAPRMDTSGCAEALDLAAMPLARRDGFVFVNLDAAARPLEQALADLPDGSRFGLARLARVRALEYRVEANWKLVCENYSECYHCPRAHPQLDRLSELSAGGFEQGACFNGGPMRLRAGFDTLSTTGRSNWPRLGDGIRSCLLQEGGRRSPESGVEGKKQYLTPAAEGKKQDLTLTGAPTVPISPAAGLSADAGFVHYYLVYPNLMLGIHPDYLTVHSVWPVSAHSARVACEIFVPGETLALPGFDPAPVIDFWDLTNTQDWALCERVQRGLGSRGYRPGPYAPSERCVHAFDRWYAEWLVRAMAQA